MDRISHPFTTEDAWLELRAKNINSTEVSALFGLCPYMTEFELWHQKKSGEVVRIEQTERMKWGKRLEKAIAEGIADEKGWEVIPATMYEEVPDLRIGSSYDYNIVKEDAMLEVKNVDGLAFREGWKVDGENLEAPVHIELQVQHQLLVSGCKTAYIVALVGGNKSFVIKREVDEKVRDEILKRCAAFWESIDKGIEPAPDFRRDAETVKKLFGKVEEGKTIDVVGDATWDELARDYDFVGKQIKELEADREGIKAQMIAKAEDAETVQGNDWKVTLKMQKASSYTVTKKASRVLRMTWTTKPEEEK